MPRSTGFAWRAGLAAAVLAACALPAPARPGPDTRDPLCAQPRGAFVGTALLVEYYNELPQPREDEPPRSWAARMEKAVAGFRDKVAGRYTEATLQRLLDCPEGTARQAAVLARGLLGSMKSNEAVAGRLRDDDPAVRRLAGDALWSLWFRGDTEANNEELQRLMGQRDGDKAVAGLSDLIKKAPRFAEAYNQRAIRQFQAGDYRKVVDDCQKVLQLNPYHFGAQSGMAQAYLRLRQPRAALKAYRAAYQINPNLDGVEDTIRALEQALGEEGKK
jgi:tetratricopeptide (TPR) repeat protein